VDSGRLAQTRYGTPAPVRTPAPAQTAITVPATGGDVALEPGARVHQYELIRELGRGGMGVVFAARDTRLGRRVAIKFVPEASRDLAERFLIEAQATAQCTHDNIVIIHEVDDFRGIPYMVLEFLEGKTLRDLIDLSTRVPPMRTVELFVPIMRALSRAHELGVVHRDLKPENVFVTTAGQVKVLDFGIAKALRDGSVARRYATRGRPDRHARVHVARADGGRRGRRTLRRVVGRHHHVRDAVGASPDRAGDVREPRRECDVAAADAHAARGRAGRARRARAARRLVPRQAQGRSAVEPSALARARATRAEPRGSRARRR
jgi:serine/threonine protein kinase